MLGGWRAACAVMCCAVKVWVAHCTRGNLAVSHPALLLRCCCHDGCCMQGSNNAIVLILAASFLLPALVILAVAYGSGYLDALYSNTLNNMR